MAKDEWCHANRLLNCTVRGESLGRAFAAHAIPAGKLCEAAKCTEPFRPVGWSFSALCRTRMACTIAVVRRGQQHS